MLVAPGCSSAGQVATEHLLARRPVRGTAYASAGALPVVRMDCVPRALSADLDCMRACRLRSQLEEPFGILPLEAISNTVRHNIDVSHREQALCLHSCHAHGFLA